jgi:uncharacterized repeat protein (TIGR03803 family)
MIEVNGTLYGTTDEGGAYSKGTAFALDPVTGVESVLYSFKGGADAANPLAGLIDVKGMLYGATFGGGGGGCAGVGCGTVFSIDPKTGAEKVLYAFCQQQNCTDGQFPSTTPISVKGILYGTTTTGGMRRAGIVYALDPGTGAETVLHSFCSQKCTDGDDPIAGLIAIGGTLYGTTLYGGSTAGTGCGGSGCGTVYSLDPKSGVQKVLYSFANGSDGAEPEGALIAVNGTLYGTTLSGGNGDTGCDGGGCGTVFALTKKK